MNGKDSRSNRDTVCSLTAIAGKGQRRTQPLAYRAATPAARHQPAASDRPGASVGPAFIHLYSLSRRATPLNSHSHLHRPVRRPSPAAFDCKRFTLPMICKLPVAPAYSIGPPIRITKPPGRVLYSYDLVVRTQKFPPLHSYPNFGFRGPNPKKSSDSGSWRRGGFESSQKFSKTSVRKQFFGVFRHFWFWVFLCFIPPEHKAIRRRRLAYRASMLRLLAGRAVSSVSSGLLRTASVSTLTATVLPRPLGSLLRVPRIVISTADNERSSTYAGWVFGSFAVGASVIASAQHVHCMDELVASQKLLVQAHSAGE